MSGEWYSVEQPDARFKAEGKHLFGPFYRARVLDSQTGEYLPLARGAMLLAGRASLRRAVKYGIDIYKRRQSDL